MHSDESLAWGPNLPHSVNAWTQTVHYSGTVTVHTTYPTFDTAFTNFHVVSNLVIEGGTWAQVKNPTGTEQRYRLQVSIGGDFGLGEDA